MGYGCKYFVAGQNYLTGSPLTHTHQYSYTIAQHCTAGSVWRIVLRNSDKSAWLMLRKDGVLRPYVFSLCNSKNRAYSSGSQSLSDRGPVYSFFRKTRPRYNCCQGPAVEKHWPIAYTPTQCVFKLGLRFFVLGLSDHRLYI
jgi:hypothetical protein